MMRGHRNGPVGVFRRADLENGLRIAVAEMPGRDGVCAGLWIGVGGRHESHRLCGISHFLEHMLFKGTRRRSTLELSQAVEGKGGYLNAFTGEESTCYYTRTARDDLDVGLDVLFDMYRGARLRRSDLERERAVILEELHGVIDTPSQYVQERLNGILWPDHALGRPLEGTPASVRRIRREDLLRFRASSYAPSNSVLAVAGSVELVEIERSARRLSRGMRRGRPPRFRPFRIRSRAALTDMIPQDTEQTYVALGFRGLSRADPRRYAARLLSVVLGENMSSRLFQVVREEHGLAYDIHSATSFMADTGALVITAGLRNDAFEAGMRLIGREVRRLRDRAVPDTELRQARDCAIGQFRLGLEGASHRMNYLAEHLLAFDSLPDPRRAIRRIGLLTAGEIRDVAASLFREDRLVLAVIGPQDPDRAPSIVRSMRLG